MTFLHIRETYGHFILRKTKHIQQIYSYHKKKHIKKGLFLPEETLLHLKRQDHSTCFKNC